MSFGGGSSSSSYGQQQGMGGSTSVNQSVSGGTSGSVSKAGSQQVSGSQGVTGSTGLTTGSSAGQSYIAANQLPFLNQLYSEAMGAYKGANLQGQAQKIVNPLMAQGQGFMKTLQGLGDPSKQIAFQEQGLRSGLDRLYTQQNQGISAQAVNAGAFGGGRQALQSAALGGEIARAYTEGRGDIVANANAQASQAAQAGINLAPVLANLGMSPYTANLGALGQVSSIIGAPTVLSSQTAKNQSQTSSFGRESSFGQGSSFSNAASWAENFARSLGLSESWNLYSGVQSANANDARFNIGLF